MVLLLENKDTVFADEENMINLNENLIIDEIQNEYDKIDSRWIKLQYYTFIGLVIFGFVFEFVVGLIWFQAGAVDLLPEIYVLKYMLAPLFFNLVLMLVGIFTMRSARISRKRKAYTVSLLLVGACFVFYMIHSIFFALFLMFTVPILMTVAYSDYTLTTVATAASLVLKIASDLFIVWDPDKVNPLASDLGTINFVISIFLLCIFYFVSMIVIRFGKEKNAASIKKEIEHYQTQQKLNIDDLTEIYNRTALRKAFQNMQNDLSGNTYTFVMIDIDNFKALNDRFGHARGDKCLKEFAGILQKDHHNEMMPFRFGGDEFCILFKNKTLESVIDTCKDIQCDLKNSEAGYLSMTMTASFGIAGYEKGMSVSQLLKNTDAALYHAKGARDSICVYDENVETF